MEHAIIGFFARLRLILLCAGIMGFLAYTAFLIGRSALIINFRDHDLATRRSDLFTNFAFAIIPVGLIIVFPVLMGVHDKMVEVDLFGAVGCIDLCLWLFIRRRYNALTATEQGEWKAILPSLKYRLRDRIVLALAAIPLVLFLCGVHSRCIVSLSTIMLFLPLCAPLIHFWRRRDKAQRSDGTDTNPQISGI